VKVRWEGQVIGDIEQTNGGRWFADAFNAAGDVIALGAFENKSTARLAVISHHAGTPIVGRINPIVMFGSPPRGMSTPENVEEPKCPRAAYHRFYDGALAEPCPLCPTPENVEEPK
jgi:hypothetical protein